MNEILGARLNTLHNLHYYQELMRGLRAAIEGGGLPISLPNSERIDRRERR